MTQHRPDAQPAAAGGRRPPHKEQLLRQGTKDFYDHGFHGTTVDGILANSGVPKGSFYHHFGSKEVFAQRVLDRYNDFQLANLARWAARDDLSTAERIRAYYLDMVDGFIRSGFRRACLAGKFSAELSASTNSIHDQLCESMTRWREGLERLLEQGQRAGDVTTDRSPGDIAETVLALVQGAFVVGLSVRNEAVLRSIADSIITLVEPRPGAVPVDHPGPQLNERPRARPATPR